VQKVFRVFLYAPNHILYIPSNIEIVIRSNRRQFHENRSEFTRLIEQFLELSLEGKLGEHATMVKCSVPLKTIVDRIVLSGSTAFHRGYRDELQSLYSGKGLKGISLSRFKEKSQFLGQHQNVGAIKH
jgi:hypothetical protein